MKTKSEKQSTKPESKPSLKRAVRSVGADREELEAQLSSQEEETYIARLRAAAKGELLDDE